MPCPAAGAGMSEAGDKETGSQEAAGDGDSSCADYNAAASYAAEGSCDRDDAKAFGRAAKDGGLSGTINTRLSITQGRLLRGAGLPG